MYPLQEAMVEVMFLLGQEYFTPKEAESPRHCCKLGSRNQWMIAVKLVSSMPVRHLALQHCSEASFPLHSSSELLKAIKF